MLRRELVVIEGCTEFGYLLQKSWKSLRLDNRQTRAIADAVNIERLYRTLLPIMVVRTPDSGGSRAVAQVHCMTLFYCNHFPLLKF